MQELGVAPIETDGSVLAIGAGEQDGTTLFAPLYRPMETLLEICQLNFMYPMWWLRLD